MNPICPNCGHQIIQLGAPHTERQAEILAYIIDFESRRGRPPSYMMIARHFNLSTRSGIAKHVRALKRQGFLRAA